MISRTWRLSAFLLALVAAGAVFILKYEYENPVSSVAESIPDTALARHYFLKADSLLNWSSFDSSIAYFQKARALYEKDGNHAGQIDCQTMIAENYRYKGEYRIAADLFNKSIADGITNLGEKNSSVATAYNKLGLVQWALGKNDSALSNFEKALALRKELLGEQHVDVGWSYNNIGLIQNALGNNDEAIKMYKKALAIIERKLGNKNDDVARILSNIGIAYKDKGNYDSSLEYYEKALKIRSDLFGDESLQVGQTYGGIAVDHFLKEDYKSAIKYYEESLRIKKKFLRTEHPEIAGAYFNLGMVYNRIQNNERALSHYHVALDKYQKAYNGNHIDIAKTFDNIGRVFLEENQPDSALNYYQKGLAVWTQLIGKKHYYMGFAYRNLGDVFLNKKKYDDALANYNRSLNINLGNFGLNHPQTAESYQRLGALYYEWGNKAAALKNYQLSIQAVCPDFNDDNISSNPSLKRVLDDNFLLRGLAAKAKILSQSAETLEPAGETYSVCADVIERIKRNFKTEDSKIDYGEQVLKIYENGIAVNYRLYQHSHSERFLQEAFRLIEKSKSYALFEALADSKAKLFSGVPDSLLEYERKLKTNIANYQKRIYQEEQKGRQKDSAIVDQYTRKIFGLERQYDDYVVHLKQKYPAYYKIKFESSPVSLYIIQSNIDHETMVADYFFGQDSLYMISIVKDTTQFRSIGVSAPIEDKVIKMKSAIAEKDKTNYMALAYELYRALLIPELTDNAGRKKLIIIPDGTLNYLPFEALLTLAQTGEPDYSDLPYLVKNYQVSYGISAGLLFDRIAKSTPLPADGVGFSPVKF